MPMSSSSLIAETVRTWNDRLRDALIEKHGELEGRMLAERYRERVPGGVRGRRRRCRSRIEDIAQLDEVVADPDRIAMRLAQTAKARRSTCACSARPRRSRCRRRCRSSRTWASWC